MPLPNGTIDLRSDTVTLPTAAMWAAMAEADLGDDVFGEDPTVNELEARAAHLLGKDAAVFVPSGTMGNLASVLAHCRRGDEMIVGDRAHIFRFEQGGVSAVGGVQAHIVPNQPDGTLRLEDVEAAIRPVDEHQPRSRLICLESTHNRCGGWPLTAAYTQAVADLARAQRLRLHLDGSRVFNAAVALGVSVRDLVAPADSVTFCLSKGLCCPVGSLICGSADFIRQARRARKVLGGGLRQAGVLAAAGCVALDSMIERLVEDHANARRLAEGLSRIPGVELDPADVRTNIIFARLHGDVPWSSFELAEQLRALGVRIGPRRDGRQFRAVTHYWIAPVDVDTALAAFRDVLR